MALPTKTTFLYSNNATASMYSCTNPDSDYPASNLADNDLHTVCRTTTNQAIFTIDTVSGFSMSTIGIAGYNMTSSAVVQFSMDNGTKSWQAASNFTTDCFMYHRASEASLRYARASITDSSLSYLEIGEMWIGLRSELAYNPQIPIQITDIKEQLSNKTVGGQNWSYDRYKRRGYEMKFIEDISSSEYTVNLRALWESRGKTRPFFFRLAPTDTNDKDMFAKIVSFDFRIDGRDMRPGNLVISEEL